MEKKPHVIIINGQPCSGKSYFLKRLSTDLDLSSISRDELKELLFNELGIADSNWSRKLGSASYSLLFNVFEKLLRSKRSFIVESNFSYTHHGEKLRSMLAEYGFDVVEIFLEADPNILIERFKKRWDSGERHRGHADNERYGEFENRLKENMSPLGLTEKLISLNTNNFDLVDYSSLKMNLVKLIQL